MSSGSRYVSFLRSCFHIFSSEMLRDVGLHDNRADMHIRDTYQIGKPAWLSTFLNEPG